MKPSLLPNGFRSVIFPIISLAKQLGSLFIGCIYDQGLLLYNFKRTAYVIREENFNIFVKIS